MTACLKTNVKIPYPDTVITHHWAAFKTANESRQNN